MNTIKSKLGFIALLLLSVVVLIPSASSKYIKTFRSILVMDTQYAYYNVLWTENKGDNAPDVLTINSANYDTLVQPGRYLVMVKGGNGGDGYDASGTDIDGGYGGVLAGVMDFDPTKETIYVYLGTSGGDGISGCYTSESAARALAGCNSLEVSSSDEPTVGRGGLPLYNVTSFNKVTSGAGGGATLLYFATEGESFSQSELLFMAGGGGGGGSIYSTTAKAAGCGGAAGSNIISVNDSSHNCFASLATDDSGNTLVSVSESGGNTASGTLVGTVYYGYDGAGYSASVVGGTGGTTSGVSGGGNGYTGGGGGGSGGMAQEYSGAGGGGYGGGGSTYISYGSPKTSAGGGGGSSFVSERVESIDLATYIESLEATFEQMGYLKTDTRTDGLLTVNSDGTVTNNHTGDLEKYTYVVIAYLGPSTST